MVVRKADLIEHKVQGIGKDGTAALGITIHEAEVDQLEGSNTGSDLEQARFAPTVDLHTSDTLDHDLRCERHGHAADLEFKLRIEGAFAELQRAVLDPMKDA